MTPRMHFRIDDADLEAAFGKAVDPAYWEANNLNLIVTLHRKQILDSSMQICLDVGDDDTLLLFGPVEYFHRMLWDAGIKHEYRRNRNGHSTSRVAGSSGDAGTTRRLFLGGAGAPRNVSETLLSLIPVKSVRFVDEIAHDNVEQPVVIDDGEIHAHRTLRLAIKSEGGAGLRKMRKLKTYAWAL